MTPVDSPDELTAAWLTQAFGSVGQEVDVRGVEAMRIGTGQIGATYRLVLDHDSPELPGSVIAKLADGDDLTRSLIAPGYRAEVGFYTKLAASLHVRRPHCWFGEISDDGTVFTLLLEDLASHRPGVQAVGCSVEQARSAVDNLIGLHVPRWSDPSLLDVPFLMKPDPDMAEMMGAVLVSAMTEFGDRYASELGDRAMSTLRAAAEVTAEWQLTRTDVFSVLHGDYRLDNLMFPASGNDVVALDWQTAAVGPPLRDVAFFLSTSLEPAIRERHEESLVARYHAAISRGGITDYAADRCWDDYRLGLFQAPMITVIGCIHASGIRTPSSDAMFVAMASRAAAAIETLDAFAVL